MVNKKPIVVPWDFSDKAEFALEHAINYANMIDTVIILLHIVKKKNEIEPAQKKLEETVEEIKEKYGFTVQAVVKEGSIFTTISKYIDEINALLAVMGTHGIHGMQKITGSWALKVIAGSTAPFIVVQAPPVEKEVNDIVVPMDFKVENKGKLTWMFFINKIFPTKFHIVYVEETDKLAKQKLLSNIKVAIDYLSEKGMTYEIKKLEGSGSLADQTIEYSKDINASMIIVMTTRNIGTFDYMFGASEQKIIANPYKIPVMCINPIKGKYMNFV